MLEAIGITLLGIVVLVLGFGLLALVVRSLRF